MNFRLGRVRQALFLLGTFQLSHFIVLFSGMSAGFPPGKTVTMTIKHFTGALYTPFEPSYTRHRLNGFFVVIDGVGC